MKLKAFRVNNYRSINDSGLIDTSRITALIGRNESGKSNLLLALFSLNPSEGFQQLNIIKDFPRHRRLEECNAEIEVVSSYWELNQDEREQIAKIWPRAKEIKDIQISRCYGEKRSVSFTGISAQQFDKLEINKKVRKIVPAIKAVASKLGNEARAKLEKAADIFKAAINPELNQIAWAQEASNALSRGCKPKPDKILSV